MGIHKLSEVWGRRIQLGLLVADCYCWGCKTYVSATRSTQAQIFTHSCVFIRFRNQAHHHLRHVAAALAAARCIQSHPSTTPNPAPDVWVKLLRCCVQSPKCKPLLTVSLVQLYCQGVQSAGELLELRRGAGVLGAIGGSAGDRAAVELHLEVMELRQQAAKREAVLKNFKKATQHLESVVQLGEALDDACTSRSYAKWFARYADVLSCHGI